MTPSLTPLIGITADSAGGAGHAPANAEPALFLFKRYLDAIETAGGASLILPIAASRDALARYLDAVQGLLVSGGNFDIPPRFYGEPSIKQLGNLISERTEFELRLIRLALDRDLPVLGICGGAQAINVVLGGSLYQDISTQCPGAVKHRSANGKGSGGHRIDVQPGTLLSGVLRRRGLDVNTTHHQAVKRLGTGLVVNAVAEDGVIEGIESTRHSFVIGVQWHPEVLAPRHPSQRRLLRGFTAACRNYRPRKGFNRKGRKVSDKRDLTAKDAKGA
jgi:putative glutamine amidotransferase